MSDWEIVRHQVAIAGRVTDDQTGRAIAGAQVEIMDASGEFKAWLAMRAIQYGDRWAAMPERPDRTRSAADGHYHFLDLPAGKYMLTASLPGAGTRYGEAEPKEVEVSTDGEGHIKMATAILEPPPTALQGRITGQDGEPLAMAEVQVVGGGERTYSDGEGNYRLTGLETGKRTVVVSARGYWDAEKTVTLERPGQAVTGVDLTLTPTTEPEPAPPAQACGTQPPPTAPNRRRGQKSRE